MNKLEDILFELGKKLDFEVAKDVGASEAAWVDVVWFDKHIPFSDFGFKKPKMQQIPVIPVVGFEVERKTCLDAKHVKGSVTNLENLGCLVGVIVLGKEALIDMRKYTKENRNKTDNELWNILRKRVSQWVYAESKTQVRLVISTEEEILRWAGQKGILF